MAIDWSLVEHFREQEFDHPDRIDEILVYLLDRVRQLAAHPIHITSDVRPEDSDSSHADGLAVDISDNADGDPLGSRWRFLVLRAAYDAGFHRIGIYDRHIHLDISEDRPEDVCWIGESR